MKLVFITLFFEIIFFNFVSCRRSSPAWIRSGHTEGDIVIRRNRNGIVNPAARWPDKTVCYRFSGNFTQNEINLIYQTVNTAFNETCIKFRHCNCSGHYVNITNDQSGCFAYLGYLGHPQQLNLGTGCIYSQVIIHEFMHVLGFYHEQSRVDRDNYIEILTDNIESGFASNFDKPTENTTTFGQPYDFCSIMHYDLHAFSKNDLPTIRIKCNANCDVGHVLQLSQIDKNKINSMYDCGAAYPIVPVPAPTNCTQ